MIRLHGFTGAWNYTYGPALIYEGPRSLGAIQRAPDPVVVVAETLPLSELLIVDIRHIRGFVLARGEDDEVLLSFLIPERRAAVLGVRDILEHAVPHIPVIVDGVLGEVYLDPDAETINLYRALRQRGPPPFDRETLPLLVRQVAARMLPKMPMPAPGVPSLPPAAFENAILSNLIPFTGRALTAAERAVALEAFLAEQNRFFEEQTGAAAAAQAAPPPASRERRTPVSPRTP